MSQIISWIFIVFILAGCSSIKSMVLPAEIIEPSASTSANNIDSLHDELRPGLVVDINDPTFSGEIKARIGQGYKSALGLECYQVKIADADLAYEPVAICRRDAGAWFIAPRIWARSRASN